MKLIDIVEEPFEISVELNLIFFKKVIGLLCYTEFEDYLKVDRFSVHKCFRGKGYGYKMISILKEIAQATPGIKWIQVSPRSEDTLSDKLISIEELNKKYKRYGFQGDENFTYNKNNQVMKLPIVTEEHQ